MKRFVGVVAFVTALSSAAYADGIPQGYSPSYQPFSWTGLYIGAHAGWEQKDIEGSDFVGGNYVPANDPFFFGFAPDSQEIEGWLGGGQFGYNHQFDRVVVGTELSGSWGDVDGNGNCFPGFQLGTPRDPTSSVSQTVNCNAKQDWTVQWLNKLGYAFGGEGRLLAYVTGGIAASELSINRSFTQTITQTRGADTSVTTQEVNWSGSQTFIGVVLGGGLQYAITDHISFGVEYLHAEYASGDITISGSDRNTSCFNGVCEPGRGGTQNFVGNVTDQFDTDTVRGVLNFKFGSRAEPVAVLK